jgi:hypothetical protein
VTTAPEEFEASLHIIGEYTWQLENENKELRSRLAEAQEKIKNLTPTEYRVYTSSTPPPKDVTLLSDGSNVVPFLHRVGDLWQWSEYAARERADLAHFQAAPWEDCVKCARGELRVVDSPARTYTAASDEPPADVTLLRDGSHVCPFLHRVEDRWQWSSDKNRSEARLSYDKALPWFDAAYLAYKSGTLVEVV